MVFNLIDCDWLKLIQEWMWLPIIIGILIASRKAVSDMIKGKWDWDEYMGFSSFIIIMSMGIQEITNPEYTADMNMLSAFMLLAGGLAGVNKLTDMKKHEADRKYNNVK